MSSSPGARRSPTSLVGLLLLVAIIVVGGAVLVVSGAGARVVESLYPPIAVTEQGAKIRDLYDIVFLIAAAIFFLVEGLIVWTVVRYRRRPRDVELPPQTHGNAIAEIVWTVVPTIIVAFMFVLSWQTLNEVDAPVAQPDIKIRAVAGQFQWQFDYMPRRLRPDSPATPGPTPLYQQFVPVGADGGLTVPTGRTVQLYLTSPDVIHAFYVPQFLFKRDVVPGPGEPASTSRSMTPGRPDVPRPVRGAVRRRPPDHALRGACHEPAPTSTRGWPARSPRPRPRHRPPGRPASGQPSAPAASGAPPSGEPARRDDPDGRRPRTPSRSDDRP